LLLGYLVVIDVEHPPNQKLCLSTQFRLLFDRKQSSQKTIVENLVKTYVSPRLPSLMVSKSFKAESILKYAEWQLKYKFS